MFILRTTQMPSLQQLTELEQIVAVDNAGPNLPTSTGTVRGVLVGECLQGPFVPTVVNAPADVTSLYFPNAGLFTLLSQSGPNGPWTSGSDVQDGSGGAFDGNVWAELFQSTPGPEGPGDMFPGVAPGQVSRNSCSSARQWAARSSASSCATLAT